MAFGGGGVGCRQVPLPELYIGCVGMWCIIIVVQLGSYVFWGGRVRGGGSKECGVWGQMEWSVWVDGGGRRWLLLGCQLSFELMAVVCQ
jgi:hypothetical protein